MADEPHWRVSRDSSDTRESLVARLRTAGCIFAEEEADILMESAGDDRARLEQLMKARAGGAPLEPLVGWVEFAGLRLSVGPGVFVPRQRTIHLLDLVVNELRRAPGEPSQVFVEAFAGVAPIAAAVNARLPNVRVLACERDQAAIEHAEANLAGRGTAYHSHVLNGLPGDCRGAVSVIAAVPPYVPDAEIELLPREARDHEPSHALSGGADGLDWVRALVREAAGWIAPGGLLLIELSERQLSAAAQYGIDRGWSHESTAQAEDSRTTVLALRAVA